MATVVDIVVEMVFVVSGTLTIASGMPGFAFDIAAEPSLGGIANTAAQFAADTTRQVAAASARFAAGRCMADPLLRRPVRSQGIKNSQTSSPAK